MTEQNSMSDTATDEVKLAGDILDATGYARRWGLSKRTIVALFGRGLPHMRVGRRRTRIFTREADEWMKQTFSSRRIGKAGAK